MQRYAISIECINWDKHQIDAELDENGDWVKFSDVQTLVEEVINLQDHVKKLQEENAYVNDMLENAHNRSRLREAKL